MNIVNGTKLKERYQVIKKLGEGAFGNTYLARDTDLPNSPFCVVKQLKVDPNPQILAEAQRLFENEAIILHKLGEHPQIPRLFAHFNLNNQFFLVQEFIEGFDLNKEIKPKKKWSESAVINLLKEILEVLIFIHEKNIIHRDLNPTNIMRRKDDHKIVLIDFGAVKEITQTQISSPQILRTITIGTPGFMPNEQANGSPVLASDIYAVGMIAIQALTGLDGLDLPKKPNIEQLNHDFNLNLSPNFRFFLSKMVAKDDEQRYQNAQKALEALSNLNNLSTNFPTRSITQNNLTIETQISPNNNSPPIEVIYSFPRIISGIIVLIGIMGLIGIAFFPFPRLDKLLSNKDNSNPENRSSDHQKIDPKYQTLEAELKAANWQQAEVETNQIMLSLVGREEQGNFTTASVDNLPCEELKIINELWQKNSKQKFGFTIQKKIYLATGNKIGEYDSENYAKFINKLEWNSDQLYFNEQAPKGHLPAPLINGYDDVWHDDVGLLFNRLQACGL